MKIQFKNAAQSTLASSITDSDTEIEVASGEGALFSATPEFNVNVEDECMLVTAISGDTFTVTRGLEGTPVSHGPGAIVAQTLSSRTLQRWGQDNDPLWNSDRPALGRILNDAGTGILVASDFTSINTGSTTYTDQFGTILMRAIGAAGENIRAKVRTAPSTPYTITAGFHVLLPCSFSSASLVIGLGFRKSSDGKLFYQAVRIGSGTGLQLFVGKNDNPTASTATPVNVAGLHSTGNVIWIKIEDTGTNLKFYLGDGIEWVQIYSEARTTFMSGGPDQVGFLCNCFNASFDMLVRLCHWSVG